MNSYIYGHINPDTGSVMYVGCGTGDRARNCRDRSEAHREFLDHLKSHGYVPDDWVIYFARDIDKAEGHALERMLIEKLKPALNWQGTGKPRACATKVGELADSTIAEIRRKRREGSSYNALAAEFSLNKMTVYRLINQPRPHEMRMAA